MAYLRHHYEPDNKTKLLKMQQRAKAYQVIGNELYKTSDIGPLLRCLSKVEGRELLAEIHLGVWGGGHIGSRGLTAKVFTQGFYWPSIIDDASKIVATCEAYQNSHQTPELRPNHHNLSHLRGRCRDVASTSWGF
jgi:hypothetical protein